MENNIKNVVGETLGLCFWTKAIRGKTGNLETAWRNKCATWAALKTMYMHSSLGIPDKKPTVRLSGILAGT